MNTVNIFVLFLPVAMLISIGIALIFSKFRSEWQGDSRDISANIGDIPRGDVIRFEFLRKRSAKDFFGYTAYTLMLLMQYKNYLSGGSNDNYVFFLIGALGVSFFILYAYPFRVISKSTARSHIVLSMSAWMVVALLSVAIFYKIDAGGFVKVVVLDLICMACINNIASNFRIHFMSN